MFQRSHEPSTNSVEIESTIEWTTAGDPTPELLAEQPELTGKLGEYASGDGKQLRKSFTRWGGRVLRLGKTDEHQQKGLPRGLRRYESKRPPQGSWQRMVSDVSEGLGSTRDLQNASTFPWPRDLTASRYRFGEDLPPGHIELKATGTIMVDIDKDEIELLLPGLDISPGRYGIGFFADLDNALVMQDQTDKTPRSDTSNNLGIMLKRIQKQNAKYARLEGIEIRHRYISSQDLTPQQMEVLAQKANDICTRVDNLQPETPGTLVFS